MTTDDRFVKRDRMRYTKNSLSSSLALLAIVFNVLYFVSIYQSDKGKFYYTILIGASVLYNLVFMLMAFLSSEGVKNYKPGYSWLLLALGVGQVARIFILPQQAHEAVVQNAPVMGDGSMANKKLNECMKKCAREHEIPYQVESFLGHTYTDADKMHQTGDGVVTALLSLPLRYMHSPSEVCQISDIEHAINLLAELLCTLKPDTDLDPFA